MVGRKSTDSQYITREFMSGMSVTRQNEKNRSKTNTLTSQNDQKRSIKAKTKSVKKNTTGEKKDRQSTTPQWFGIRARTKQHIQNMLRAAGQKQNPLNGPSIANPTLKEDSQRLAIKTIINGTKSSD